MHLGPTKLPVEESDPRVTIEPNFYYPQEDALWAWCKKHSVEWTIAMPSAILGAVPDAAMNVAYPLAVYAAVSKHLGEPLVFTSDLASWQNAVALSSAMVNAYFEEWSVLTPAAGNQKFNVVDNSSFTWEQFWPILAGWYGLEAQSPDFSKDAVYMESEIGFDPPPRG